MFRGSSMSLAILYLSVLQLSVMSVEGQTFRYSKVSCVDLIPRHMDAIKAANKEDMENHVEQATQPTESTPTESTGETSTTQTTMTTTTTTTTTPAAPPPEVGIYRGNLDIKILTSEDAYRRLKTLEVTLQAPSYFNGFMVQARRVSGQGNVVGRFLELPSRGEFLTCPKGKQDENTAISEAAPVRLANLTLTWMAPEENVGPIEFVASILLNAGMEYKTYKSQRLRLSMYPVSTKDCAVSKSCFRYCMKNGGKECPAHKTRYMATVEYMNKKSKAKFTIGGQLPDDSGYIAVGFSQDGKSLSDADITTCYRTEDDKVGVEHYLLESLDYAPDLHLGVLKLDSFDVDDDYVWCTFTRPLKGKTNDVLDLSDSTFFFYFWGMKNGTNIYIPASNNLKRSPKKIDLEDEHFNEIVYNSAPNSTPVYTSVAALIIFFCVHFLW